MWLSESSLLTAAICCGISYGKFAVSSLYTSSLSSSLTGVGWTEGRRCACTVLLYIWVFSNEK